MYKSADPFGSDKIAGASAALSEFTMTCASLTVAWIGHNITHL